MAVTTVQPHPTLSNPERKKESVTKALRTLDEDLCTLYCILGSASADHVEGAPIKDELVEALEATHRRLKIEHERLCALL